MTDADYLRSLPRRFSPEESSRRELQRDAERGPYVPHGRIVHHVAGEAAH